MAIAGALTTIANRFKAQRKVEETLVSLEDEFDESSKATYACWVQCHQGCDKITGCRSADMRSALVACLREEGRIMIATEVGTERINSSSARPW